jgi:hypothetical protein
MDNSASSGQGHEQREGMNAEQTPLPPKRLTLPWLTPLETFIVYTIWLVLALAVVSLSFPSAWHQVALVLQALALGWGLFAFVILGIRGYDEERIGNKRLGGELLGLSGVFFLYFGCVTAFGATTWPLWIQSSILVLLLLMSLRARVTLKRGASEKKGSGSK